MTLTAIPSLRALLMVRAVLLLTLLAALAPNPARAAALDSDEILDFVKAKSGEMLLGAQVQFRGPTGLKGVSATLPVYTVHNGRGALDPARIDWLYAGIGYGHFEGGLDRLQAGVLLDLLAVSHKLWRQWLAGHVTVTPLPALKAGIVLQAPDLNRLREPWVIGERAGFTLAWRLGGAARGKGADQADPE